jgi:hypothetical protein
MRAQAPVAFPTDTPAPAPFLTEWTSIHGARPGEQASVAIHGAPNTACEFLFLPPGDHGEHGWKHLGSQTTDSNGDAVFTWTVNSDTPLGTAMIEAQCRNVGAANRIIIG